MTTGEQYVIPLFLPCQNRRTMESRFFYAIKYLTWCGALFFFSAVKGQSWQMVYQTTDSVSLNDIFFVSDSLGWSVGGGGRILKTEDAGEHWEEQIIGPGYPFSPYFRSVYFVNGQRGWTVSTGYDMYQTSNGGQTWQELPTLPNPAPGNTLWDIAFVNADTGWVIMNTGYIYRTNNGGNTWEVQLHNPDAVFSKIQFVNPQKGWVAGFTPPTFWGIIYSTENGGQSWTPQFFNMQVGFQDIFVLSNSTLWLTSLNRIYRTTDGGGYWSNWSVIDEVVEFGVQSTIWFSNDTLGWTSLSYDFQQGIYVSKDGGQTWLKQSIDEHESIRELIMLSPDYGWAVTTDGKILRYRGAPAACSSALVSPPDGAVGAALQPTLRWNHTPGCVDGYTLSLGTAPGLDDLLLATDIGYDTSYALASALPPGTEVFVSIRPYNQVYGPAADCGSYSFTTLNCPEAVQIDTSFCSGENFVWGDTTLTTPGNYPFTYPLANGCDSVVILKLIEESPYYVEVDTSLSPGGLFDGVAYYADTSLVYQYTALNGCDSLVKIQVRIVVGSREPDDPAGEVTLYPNPARNSVTVHWQGGGPAPQQWRIFNMGGQQVSAGPWPAGTTTVEIGLGGLAAGAYWVTAEWPGRMPVRRVLMVGR